MNPQALENAAQALLVSVMVDGDWNLHLDDVLVAMGAFGGGPSRAVPPQFFAVPSPGARELFDDFKAGRAPPLTNTAILAVSPKEGFVVDQGLPAHERRRREPFIAEFLAPGGVFDTAAAFLDDTDEGNVRLLVFRDRHQGRFAQDELQAFDRSLPYLRAATMISRGAFTASARRDAEPFSRRGEAVFYLGPDGRVVDSNAAAQQLDREPLRILERRLVAAWSPDQSRLDRGLTKALVHTKPSLVSLSGKAATVMALVLPVVGDARDVFHALSAVVVLIDPARRPRIDDAAINLLNEGAGLTGRELDVVRAVGMGHSPKNAANELGIAYGTLRNHLKSGFSKLGVHTQGELVALVQRLR